ncbi:hypothetical protein M413DRAFT_446987 [Hebeloma cylindrosporum]|uniref:DUF4238 domain-containing protein n=1 Tax=Hebeloma cylindrosporum TaxID=76867 RepID=A0A0C3C5F3_HEBCY|nr:hypothetical protein M413DRAFT_446987 [Hebeloma cylindrosporum h7]
MEAEASAQLKKDQFHHAIPRFILRQFLAIAAEPQAYVSRRERKLSLQGISNKERAQLGVNCVFVYQLSDRALVKRSLGKVYGHVNLYRDVTEASNVDHLEVKFSLLENKASNAIRSIHDGLQASTFTLSRTELATVRKFIFLMHYRTEAVSSRYFQETDPQNAPIAEWIRTYKATRRLETGIDIWRDGLKYYHTPHSEIMATGERLRERYGDPRLREMLRERFDPGLEEEWFALDYWSLANYFFLGVWEAAEGSEFVLGGTAFGLWEGLIYGSPGAHRLYVVSPRIAIVLRRTFLRQHQFNDSSAVVYSCLAGIPIGPPKIKYADERMVFTKSDDVDPWIHKSMFDTYLASKTAQDDGFTFPITKLSTSQTYSVNEVIMMHSNLHSEGSLTFSSAKVMLDTLKMYMRSPNTFLGGKRSLFQPLLRELSSMIGTPTGPSVPLDLSWTPETDADLQLQTFLRFLITKTIHFPSTYNRAYVVLHMATEVSSLTNSVSARIRSLRDKGIYRFRRTLDPPVPSFLPLKEESELFFALVGYKVDMLGVGTRTNDLLANIIYEAAIIGITHWLADNRSDVLSEYLYPWMSVTV